MKRYTDWNPAHDDRQLAELFATLPARRPSDQTRARLSGAAASFTRDREQGRARLLPFADGGAARWFRHVVGGALAAALVLFAVQILRTADTGPSAGMDVASRTATDDNLAVFWTDTEDAEYFSSDLFETAIIEESGSSPVEGRMLDLDGQIAVLAEQIEDF